MGQQGQEKLIPRSQRGWVTFGEYNKDCLEDLFYDGWQIECKVCGSVRVLSVELKPNFWLWCEGCKEVVSGKKFKVV